jgi:hypothetical protein
MHLDVELHGDRPAASVPRSGASRGRRDSVPGSFASATPASASSSCPAMTPADGGATADGPEVGDGKISILDSNFWTNL